MHRKASRIDRPVGLTRCALRVALQIDLHEIRCANLGIRQAERVDEEMRAAILAGAVFKRQAQGDVVVDQLGPAEVSKDAVARCQLHACDPFTRAAPGGAMGLDVRSGIGIQRKHRHDLSPGRGAGRIAGAWLLHMLINLWQTSNPRPLTAKAVDCAGPPSTA